ncbi:hypothetical protein BGY98DRAFT_936904 [Russula aff. rugulosa BPL654]|nr:hypothetical protein BGY98DRAFT_936904 [Russula aff. rugulosa BPL654]
MGTILLSTLSDTLYAGPIFRLQAPMMRHFHFPRYRDGGDCESTNTGRFTNPNVPDPWFMLALSRFDAKSAASQPQLVGNPYLTGIAPLATDLVAATPDLGQWAWPSDFLQSPGTTPALTPGNGSEEDGSARARHASFEATTMGCQHVASNATATYVPTRRSGNGAVRQRNPKVMEDWWGSMCRPRKEPGPDFWDPESKAVHGQDPPQPCGQDPRNDNFQQVGGGPADGKPTWVEGSVDEEAVHHVDSTTQAWDRLLLDASEADFARGAVQAIKCRLCPDTNLKDFEEFKHAPTSNPFLQSLWRLLRAGDSLIRHNKKPPAECRKATPVVAAEKRRVTQEAHRAFILRLKHGLLTSEDIERGFSEVIKDRYPESSKKKKRRGGTSAYILLPRHCATVELARKNIWAPQVSGSKSDWDVEIKKWVLLHTHKEPSLHSLAKEVSREVEEGGKEAKGRSMDNRLRKRRNVKAPRPGDFLARAQADFLTHNGLWNDHDGRGPRCYPHGVAYACRNHVQIHLEFVSSFTSVVRSPDVLARLCVSHSLQRPIHGSTVSYGCTSEAIFVIHELWLSEVLPLLDFPGACKVSVALPLIPLSKRQSTFAHGAHPVTKVKRQCTTRRTSVPSEDIIRERVQRRMNRHHKARLAASSSMTRLKPIVRTGKITQIATFKFLPTSTLSLNDAWDNDTEPCKSKRNTHSVGFLWRYRRLVNVSSTCWGIKRTPPQTLFGFQTPPFLRKSKHDETSATLTNARLPVDEKAQHNSIGDREKAPGYATAF